MSRGVSDADAFVGAYERKERSPLRRVSYTLQVLIGVLMDDWPRLWLGMHCMSGLCNHTCMSA